MGVFSLKFSIAPSSETTDRIKKIRGCKNGMDLLYHHAKYGGDRGSRAGCRRKSVMYFFFVRFFVFFLSRFGITKFVITETPWCSEIFTTIMAPLHRGRFLVVHLYSDFSMDPLDFFLGENLYKNCYFWRFSGPKATFFKATKVKVCVIVGTWETLLHAKFCKNCLRGYTAFGKIYTKNYQLFAIKPTFLKPHWKNLAWGCDPGRPYPTPNSVKIR